jgi:hypothetical protein
MASEDYIPVAGDDWYQRRREDAEGEFFRGVASQGPRKGDGGSTRQGIYCFTADGKLLTYKNAGQNPDVMRETIKQGLREWQKLPEERRKPDAVKVEDLTKADPQYARTPPPGGLIVNVYTRILDHEKDSFCRGTCRTQGGEASARDHLWLTEAEWRAMVPENAKKGDRAPLPTAVAERILRFHLTDNTRGEPNMWRRDEIRSKDLVMTVEEVTPASIRLRLDGSAVLATRADVTQAERGFDVRLFGYLGYDRAKKAIDRFDILAAGDHWGEGTFTRRARPGKMPLGVAFELSDGKSGADRVPPQAAREINGYYGRER